VARHLAPGHVDAGRERPITVDQTNVSVVVDEAVIVKWFVPPVPHPHPGVAILEHLQLVGFADMPRFFGVEVLDGSAVATVSELVPDAVDGWEWFVDELTGWVDGTVGRDAVLASARSIGEVGARLHVALASPSVIVPRPTTCIDASWEARRCRTLLNEASALAGGEAAAVLAERAALIEAVFDAVDVTVPAVDVASLVQSVDHAGRVAQKRRPAAAATLDDVIQAAVDATLGACNAELRRAGRAELLDDALLWPLRVAQELHELVYAARHLPRWAYAPTATLRAMFPIPGQ
jgi:maltokinase